MGCAQLGDLPDSYLLALVADESSRDALRELFERHSPWLRARLRNRCADTGVVADALQDTFVAVWRGASGYDGRGAVAAWLWGIAVRRLIGLLRTRRPVVELRGDDELEISAEEVVLAGVEYGDLAGALRRLSPELRAVVQATILDDLTTKEAARLLNVPQGTVKTRMVRARRQLREELA